MQEKNENFLKKFFYLSFLPPKTHKKGEKKAGSLEPDVHLCSDYSIWGWALDIFRARRGTDTLLPVPDRILLQSYLLHQIFVILSPRACAIAR